MHVKVVNSFNYAAQKIKFKYKNQAGIKFFFYYNAGEEKVLSVPHKHFFLKAVPDLFENFKI